MKDFDKVVFGILIVGAVVTGYVVYKNPQGGKGNSQETADFGEDCPAPMKPAHPVATQPDPQTSKSYWEGPNCGWWSSAGKMVDEGTPCDCNATVSPSL